MDSWPCARWMGSIAGQMRPCLCVCLWIWAPATPATHPRIVYLFGGGPPRPTRDPPKAAATHTEELANRVERFDALRAPKNTSALRAHTHFRAHLTYYLRIWRRVAATRPKPPRPTQRKSQIKSSVSVRFARRTNASALRAPKNTRASRADRMSASFARRIKKRASRAVKC